jgi:hypothetical protein
MMPEQRKIKSVTELAKYRVGDTVWWVILRPLQAGLTRGLPEHDEWMKKHHPKVLYEWGPGKIVWGKALLPKLQHVDFGNIVPLLTSKILVDQFPICDILRSRDTGEFFYSNADDEWMPESYLLTTKIAADRERTRILRLFQKWIDNNK